jgi:hypothetical protein
LLEVIRDSSKKREFIINGRSSGKRGKNGELWRRKKCLRGKPFCHSCEISISLFVAFTLPSTLPRIFLCKASREEEKGKLPLAIMR